MIDAFERWMLRNFEMRGRAYAAQLASRASRTIIGLCTLAGTTIFIGVTFQGIVAPVVLTLWLAAMAVVIATPIVMMIVFAIQAPGTENAIRPYIVASEITTACLSALIAASIWILLPNAGLPIQFMMLVLYIAFVAMVLGADGSPAVMVQQLIVMVSAIAFVLAYRLPFAVPLSFVLGGVVISLVGLNRLTYRATQAAIAARAETERVNQALESALADLAAQRDAKTQFIAAASHDLRQPIQAAALYFERALSDAEPQLRDRAIAGARRAFASVDALLDTMLDHLRLEAGAATARLEPVALNTILSDVVDRHTPAAGGAAIRLTKIPSAKWVMADPAMLHRVLDNIVGNAIRHSGAQRLLLGARQTGDTIRLWVIDDGRGINPADMPRLFEDYVQGSASEGAPGGFGIGLSSSQRMMALMQGEIALNPRWRGGAAFSLQLPAADAPHREQLWKAA